MSHSYDAYISPSAEGLLEFRISGQQDFTVNITQYDLPVLNADNSLVHFTISNQTDLLSSTYLAQEAGFLIGNQNLHIINQAGVSRIIIFSNNEDYINIVGDISIEGNPAEIIFVGSKIYINNAKFSGESKATFCAIPQGKELDLTLLTENPAAYSSGNKEADFDLYIGSKGFLSSKHNLEIYASSAKFMGEVDVKEFKGHFNEQVILHKKVYAAQSLSITSPRIETHYLIKSAAINLNTKQLVLATGNIESPGAVVITKIEEFLVGSNTKIISYSLIHIESSAATLKLANYQNAVKVNFVAPRIEIFNPLGYIHIEKAISIDSGDSLILRAQQHHHIYGILKAENYLEMVANGEIHNFGKIFVKSGRTHLQGTNIYFHSGSLSKTMGDTDFIASNLVFLESGSKLYAQKWIVHNSSGGRINKIHIQSAVVVTKKDSYLNSHSIIIERTGEFIKGSYAVNPTLFYHNWDDKFTISGSCIKEYEIKNTLGITSKLLVGGNLYLDTNHALNKYSIVQVSGATHGTIDTISDEIKNIGDWKDEKIKRNHYIPTAIKHHKTNFAVHCDGLDINNQLKGHGTKTIKTIDAITKDHSNQDINAIYNALLFEEVMKTEITKDEQEGSYNLEAKASTIHIYTEEEVANKLKDEAITKYAEENYVQTKQHLFTSKEIVFEDEETVLEENYDDSLDEEYAEFDNDEEPAEELICDAPKVAENKVKTIEEIWQEFKSLNPSISKEEYSKIEASFNAIEEITASKNIDNWSKEDIENWQIAPERIKDNLSEVLAVIKRALYLTYNLDFRDIQVISVLSFYHAPGSRIAQIATGEGKTVIVAALALVKALEGEFPDIVTSSSELAKEAAEQMLYFYKVFGFSCSHNTEVYQGHGIKEAYKHRIVYGDVVSFTGDKLRHENSKVNILGDRRGSIIIVDEVDSMFIDQSSHTVLLSEHISRFEFLNPAFIAIWSEFQMIVSQLQPTTDGGAIWYKPIVEDGKVVATDEIIIPNYNDLIREILTNFITDEILGSSKTIKIPKHLKDYINSQKKWAESAILASMYQEDVDYKLVKTHDDDLDVRPYDKISGLVPKNTIFSDGLQQFLQVKNHLKMSSEGLTFNFASNVYFFNSYESGKIYGLSGTTGNDYDQELLSSIYKVDFIKMPSFKTKDFTLYAPKAYSNQDWADKIIESAVEIAENQQRSVLIVAAHPKQAKIFYNLLKNIYDNNKLRLYIDPDTDHSEIQNELGVGDIIISTCVASRGIHLHTSNALNEHGGLHVLLTYLPANERVDLQIFGRTARAGNPGTVQMMINYHQTISYLKAIHPDYFLGVSDFLDILDWRNEAEAARLEADEACSIPILLLKDQLFSQYRKFFAEYNNLEPNKYNAIAESLNELWGMWLKDKDQLLKCSSDEEIDIKYITNFLKAELEKFFNEMRTQIAGGSSILPISP